MLVCSWSGGWVRPIRVRSLRPPSPLRGLGDYCGKAAGLPRGRRRARTKQNKILFDTLVRPLRLTRGSSSARSRLTIIINRPAPTTQEGLVCREAGGRQFTIIINPPVGLHRPAGGGGLLADPTQPPIRKTRPLNPFSYRRQDSLGCVQS